MKILVIHNFHRSGSASGDDQVFKNETRLLEEHGVEVVRYSVSNDEFDKAGKLGKIKLTFGMLWSWKHYREVQRMIRAEKPDIVHVHTFFPLLSPSILYAAKRENVPVVATLHDTRFICPCSTSLRSGKICNECGDGHYGRMCKYKCFKGSALQSFWVSCVFDYHRRRRTFYEQIDKYICLNDVQIKLLEGIGFSKEKIVKKYNFCPESKIEELTEEERSALPERYIVFYGRLSEEKGVRELMQVWDELSIPLVIMGGGSLEEEVKAWAEMHNNITYLGYTEHSKCLSIVQHSEFVVFPSIWYEGCSMVELETMSTGRGVVAFDIGFSSEAIVNGFNGYKVPVGDLEKFKSTVSALWDDADKCQAIGIAARKEYEEKYRPEDNYKQLKTIYESVLR